MAPVPLWARRVHRGAGLTSCWFWFCRYYWKGDIQDASEVLMLVKTKSSRVQRVVEYVRSVHPYANPEVLSLPVQDGSVEYLRWMDDAVPDD
ncbi:Protein CutA [Liparis tanakae]|uniref:Protein CutA n=1 Tax=Liparis tanakae TaxID=230148 RepID=A0A4Z2IVA1_9TELE|nr:Protein CutA [Liparis tanakae]